MGVLSLRRENPDTSEMAGAVLICTLPTLPTLGIDEGGVFTNSTAAAAAGVGGKQKPATRIAKEARNYLRYTKRLCGVLLSFLFRK